jgi:hypothetical protein
MKNLYGAVAFVLLSLSLSPKTQAESSKIKVATLPAGNYNGDQNPRLIQEKNVDLASLPRKTMEVYDYQYRKKNLYRVLPLQTVLKAAQPGAKEDMALLVFANGMRVPVYFSGPSSPMLDSLYLADGWCQKKGVAAQGKKPARSEITCAGDFPEISKDDQFAILADPRPIQFHGNKIVSTDGLHPDLGSKQLEHFSPWNHADSLKQILLVSSHAYWQQFSVGEEDGFAVFKQRCQFCHGVNYVGASFGWDFVQPLKLADKRSPEQLLNHIKYPKALRTSQGLMMPVQKDVTPEEMAMLWKWMKLIGSKPLEKYHP